jgi:peroxiredoxin
MDKILFSITCCVLLLMSSGCSQDMGGPKAEVGQPAPGFTLSDTQGNTWSLDELRGQVVFVNFWATWCPPCIQEMPSMQKLYTSLPPDKFKMLAIMYNDTSAMATNLAAKLKLTFPLLTDLKGFTALSYGLTGVPETYIIDKQGILREKFIGPVKWDSPGSRQLLMKYIDQE